MRHLCFAWLVVCSCGDFEVDIDDLVAENQLAGRDPCDDPEIRRRANVRAVAGDAHRFIGTNARDVIFGTPGRDVISGNGGDDLICGLDGDDVIDGGNGRDTILAGPGADVVHGRGGSDRIWGGPGPDVLFGDILDDDLYGQDGNDVLIGGHGTDLLDGGADNDFMRGDTGNDVFIGDHGHDLVSFATALPPGQPEVRNDGSANPIEGVDIDLEHTACNDGGCADGDGGNEALHGIEQVVGSPFRDRIHAPGRIVESGFGEAVPTPVGFVYIATAMMPSTEIVDLGVVVLGTAAADDLRIVGNGNVVTVTANTALGAGEGCVASGATVRCDIGVYLAQRAHRAAPFHFVTVWGDGGADRIEIVGDFPRDFETHASGGDGSDHLLGGAQQDVFFTGTSGIDQLEGRGGDDALLGESHHTLAWTDGRRPEVAAYDDGADILDGGEGNDQLVVDYVCGGHRLIGGPGFDIAGFARSGKPAIHAQLGGPATTKTRWWGFAANMELCGSLPGRWTSFRQGVAADLEVLEASDGPDRLWGDDGPNVIWSRGGGDRVWALGGNDEIRGADGRDVLDGGSGDNAISYGDQRPQ
jgi:Ca2+-binding RTX toxin-like protein